MPAKPKMDLVGKKFGRLTVLGIASSKGEQTKFRCLCDCGAEKAIRRSSIISGITVSCGCYFSEAKSASSSLDISGLRSGRLVAVRRVGTDEATRCAKWECRCDCGNPYIGLASRIKAGLVTSCGCAKLDRPRLGPKRWRDLSIQHAALRRARVAGAHGEFTEEQVKELFRKQRGRCANCGEKLCDRNMTRDHRRALSQGGSNDIMNIELLCSPCNIRKHAKDPLVWAKENGRLL